MHRSDQSLLKRICRNKKIAIFLATDRGLIEAVRAAEPSEIATYEASSKNGDTGSGTISLRYQGLDDVRANNADVLVLGGAASLALARKNLRSVEHAGVVLLPLRLGAMLSAYFIWRNIRRRRLVFMGWLRLPRKNRARRWLAFELTRRRIGPQFFLPPSLEAPAFFGGIRSLRYSMLGELHASLRRTKPGDGLILLVHNEDVAALDEQIAARFGCIPIEIYTPLSAPGHALESNVSYLPPPRALELLGRSTENEIGQKISVPRAALLAYIYRLLFHTPPARVGREDEIRPDTWKDRASYQRLMQLCDRAGVQRFASLQQMEELLRREDWFPPTEALSFMARRNRFLEKRYLNLFEYRPGLAVFVLRELAERRGLVRDIESMIEASGFTVLESGSIPFEKRSAVIERFRGGNWALPVDAGPPVYFIIAFDPNPLPVDPRQFVDATSTDNGRLTVKRDIRKRLASAANADSFNVLHSSDNSRGALEYVEILSPHLYSRCEELVRAA